jgi:hypothetical protein
MVLLNLLPPVLNLLPPLPNLLPPGGRRNGLNVMAHWRMQYSPPL